LDQKRIANVAIAVPAEVPALPARSPSSIIFPGFLLAMAGGIAAGYLAELADPSFRTPAEVEEMLNVTVFAAMPKQAR
jgi:capsular polysaccharide biosynthesis protein